MSEVGVGVDVGVTSESLEPGAQVEVRNRFEQRWVRGFEIAELVDDGYRVRRLSDGSILPLSFPADDVRPARERRGGQWWY